MTSPSLVSKKAVGLVLLGVIVACGGTVATIDGNNSDVGSSGSPTSTSTSTSSPTGNPTTQPTTTSTTTTGGRVPTQHRASADACDHTRPSTGPFNVPDGGVGAPVDCRTHAECTQGENGRCVGNGHDGWYCTYDNCFADGDCKAGKGLCNCEGGFRSDHNVCLDPVGCHVDGDCKPVAGMGAYCSPTLGSCGHYGKAVGYYCHTADDECVNDTDCPGNGQFGAKPYCKFEQTVGHWKCSTQECAG